MSNYFFRVRWKMSRRAKTTGKTVATKMKVVNKRKKYRHQIAKKK
jgi:hypothetical protein